jgi:hypothetical protein
VDRQPDQTPRVRELPGDALSDPPRGVRRELEAEPPVELLGCSDETEGSGLHEVPEVQSLAAEAAGVVNDEADVAGDQPPLRSETALDELI